MAVLRGGLFLMSEAPLYLERSERVRRGAEQRVGARHAQQHLQKEGNPGYLSKVNGVPGS